MSRWTEAKWYGPTPNKNPGHVECRGLVVHIASGYYNGTISWEKNSDANVSSHFVVGRDGSIAQLVDTNDTAWTQRKGNGHWLSVECEGFALDDKLHASHPGWELLTEAQLNAVAQLFFHGHQEFGYPLQLATSPDGKGLGHHSMGAENGVDWGHSHCPGEPIKGQKSIILAKAQVLAGVIPVSDPTHPAPLLVDGVLGKHTISTWQHIMGTPVDGVITQPPGRSSLVMAVQKRLGQRVDGVGIVQDGHTVYQTTKALQRHLGTPVDGKLSLPTSECVKALQRRLNTGKF